MSHDLDVTVVRSARGELLALASLERVWFAPEIEALEEDHPSRRFAAMLALVAILMQTGSDPEPYEPERARYYARYILIPDTAFIFHASVESDTQLAERFNVPLGEVVAKRRDLCEYAAEIAR